MVERAAQVVGKEINVVTDIHHIKVSMKLFRHRKGGASYFAQCGRPGIEEGADREMFGKAPNGTITLAAQNEDTNLSIVVSDDGGGIDAEAVAKAAVNKGVSSEEVANLDEHAQQM